MSEGIIYLIQPEIVLGTNIYKIGYSSNISIERILSYGKNTNIIECFKCDNPKLLESKIKDKFTIK